MSGVNYYSYGTADTSTTDLFKIKYGSGLFGSLSYSVTLSPGNTFKFDGKTYTYEGTADAGSPTGTVVGFYADNPKGVLKFFSTTLYETSNKYFLNTSQSYTTPCFARGTLIATPEGEVAVENLAVGQQVVTASGEAKLIRWIGHRTIDIARHPDPELVRPVRIAAGALAEGVPVRDLVVSCDHGMLVDGALIPARLLVNHRSITLDVQAESVTYYHVELDQHDIVIAEGALSESYLDTGNRDTFENASVTVLNPDLSVEQRLRMPADGACMPLVTETAAVLPVWQRLADRAGTSAAEIETSMASAADGGVRLIVGSRTLRPVVAQDDSLIFALPRDADQVRLVSAAARPNKARPWLDDRRDLSLAVKSITADQTAIALDGPGFGSGWWDVESAGPTSFRWSNGDAVVAVPKGTKLLTIRLYAAMPETGQLRQAEAA
jgi:hypothetical protein